MTRDLKGDWEWLAFAASLPSQPMPLSSVGSNELLVSGRGILTGYSLFNIATTAGNLTMLDGLDANGQNVATVHFGATNQQNGPLCANGILMEVGLYLVVGTLTLNGAIYWTPLWHYPKITPPGE